MLKSKGSKQLGAMMIITVITQFIAIYKSTITASNFGAGTELDAYNFANNLSTFFLTFISSGITTVIIPAFVKKKDERQINTFISVVFSAVAALLVLTFVFRGTLVDVLTNRDDVFRSYVCNLMLLTIFIQLLPALLGVTAAFFQCNDKYNIPKVLLLLTNLVTTIILIVLKNFTIYQYLWILLGGAILQFIIEIWIAVRCGFRFYICYDIHNKGFQDLLRIYFPTVFSSGIYKVNTMIDSLLSSNIGVGQLTILTYSNTIVGMVNSMLINNLCVYAYPKIVQRTKDNMEEGQKALSDYVISFHMVICLIIAGFVCVGREFIALLYERGKFTPDAANQVYLCMCIYIVGQQNNIVRDLIYRFFYSNGDTKITFRNSFMSSIINISFSILLVNFLGVYGIILGTVIAGCYSLIAIIIRFKRQYGFCFEIKHVLYEMGKTELIMVVTICLVFILKSFLALNNYIFVLLVAGLFTVIIYMLMLVLLKSKSLKLKI